MIISEDAAVLNLKNFIRLILFLSIAAGAHWVRLMIRIAEKPGLIQV